MVNLGTYYDQGVKIATLQYLILPGLLGAGLGAAIGDDRALAAKRGALIGAGLGGSLAIGRTLADVASAFKRVPKL